MEVSLAFTPTQRRKRYGELIESEPSRFPNELPPPRSIGTPNAR
jgi:hypothetical protein